MQAELQHAHSEADRHNKAAQEIEVPDIDAAQAAVSDIEQVNEKARAARAWRERKAAVDEARRLADEANDTLERLDALKRSAMESAAMPVPGLEIAEDDIALDGVLFDNLSTSMKLKTSLAIAMKLNPEMRVILIRDGNDLDEDNLREVIATAGEDYQLWIERIEPGAAAGVIIEDGRVKEVGNE